ncbi:AbiTii domain-containing protein [Spirosoma validum]|uniref:AbiTii domain-containing protein n=1 Tax=Spirosoma validum TaxID=2771355 RepID=A0A927GCK4_9BACT|nr:hypothetical protein [Spirosoma validum]MBD2752620.1 hypothetical protein [Spirosoma validum]
MIKQLIEDLAFDRITLGQGLTRAKLIASKTQNSSLREWVNQELQGYPNDDQLPDYRALPCQTEIIIGLPFGGQDIIPVGVADPTLRRYYDEYRVTDGITHIESTLKDLTDEINIVVQLSTHLARTLANRFQSNITARGGGLQGVRKQFRKASYQEIIELTKQKLLDTLLDLYEQFPNLENEFMATKENLNKVENIVNNHIWGNNNPVNVATGQNVVQKDITNNIGFSDYSKLESLGVQKEEIDDLKEIVKDNQGDKSVLKEKVMKWVIPVVTGVTSRGLYDYAPQIMEFAKKLVE